MYRRGLFTGAAALAAMGALHRGAGAQLVSAPSNCGVTTATQMRSPVIQVCVGNTQFALPDNVISDTTANSLNSRKLCFAPRMSDITDIVLAFVGFGLNNPEQDVPGGYTVKASVEYPLGTVPRQVFFGGLTSATIAPGRTLTRSDPLPMTIPAGAQFAVKTYAIWSPGNFWLTTWSAAQMVGEWTMRGTGVADHTLDNTPVATTSNIGGFAPIVYATLNSPTAAVGMIGDSIGSLTGDFVDTSIGHNGWGRAMRGMIPFINLAKSGDSFGNYFSRPEGRNLVLRNAITHCIMEMGGNDLFGGNSIGMMQSNIEAAVNPFLDRGVHCYAVTLTPRTGSTDGWLTAQNQTVLSPAAESVRVAYNTWLRANWTAIGLSGIFDIGRVADPGDTGKWNADAGATVAVASPCAGFAKLSGGIVVSASTFSYNYNSSGGGAYPSGSKSIPCVTYAYPNTGGGGASLNAVTDPVNPWVDGFTVANGGAGYTYPPMISTQGNWTADGVHPNTRGWNEIIYVCGNIAPETFTL
jgi:hypothetical protein